MKKLTATLAALTICFGITISTFAQRTSKSDMAVTSTIQNSDTVNFYPYNIQSDVFSNTSGSYHNGAESVSSIIQGIGDWELDLINFNSLRRANVDFPEKAAAISNPNNFTPPSDGLYAVRFLSQCSARGYNLQTLTLGQTRTCPLIIAVKDSNGDQYSIRFNSKSYIGTNDVPWTCTSGTITSCNGWRVQSSPYVSSGKLIAQLLKIRRVGTKTYTDDYGKYYFTFDISLAKQ